MTDRDTRKDGWYNDPYYGDVMVTYGQGFVINKYLDTVCIGDYPPPAPAPAPPDSPQSAEYPISKIPDRGKLLLSNPPSATDGIMKRGRGRPRLPDGEGSRVTAWRREKEKQLELIPSR